MKYWEIIADNLSKAGWSWGCVLIRWLPGRNKATNCEGPGITRGLNLAQWTLISTVSNNRLSAPVSARSLLPKISFHHFLRDYGNFPTDWRNPECGPALETNRVDVRLP